MRSKSLPFSVPSQGRRIVALALLLAAAGVVCVASLPRFQHFRFPVERLPFVACIYVALVALAALRWRDTAALRRLAWTPAACHLAILIFATVSFVREGHWPFYGHPDPSNLHVPWLYVLSILAVPTAWLALGGNALAILINALGTRAEAHPRAAAPRRDSRLQHLALDLRVSRWPVDVLAR